MKDDMTPYQNVGELNGIVILVEEFYKNMDMLEGAKKIRGMHPDDLTLSKKKLSYFISGWLGGPQRFNQEFGDINIPIAHIHLKIGKVEEDMWLTCMRLAIECQPYEASFKKSLLAKFSFPASKIRTTCELRYN